jgi:hypothetical protein
MSTNSQTKTITIEHENGSVQTMDVPLDFDESKIQPVKQTQLDAHFAQMQAKEAQQYLDDTDWYVVRKLDSGLDIPEQVSLKRQQSRDLISAYRATQA